MNATAKDFRGRCRGVSWHRLLLAGVGAVGAALTQTVRAEDGALQPLNTFGASQISRVELSIAPDARAVRMEDIGRRQAFLDSLVVWLSKNFDLPAHFGHPAIKFVPAQAVVAMRYAAFLNDPTKATTIQGDVVALYNTETHTIYMRDDWRGETPADVSVLVHEMVHHLQTRARVKFSCPEEREEIAFRAQQRWLSAFDTSLEREFDLDAMSLLVKSRCGF